MEPNQTQIRNKIMEILKYLPEGAKYKIEYDSRYDLFMVELWLWKINEGDRAACAKIAKVAMLLHYLNKDGLQHYRCSGYGDVYCYASVSVRRFQDLLLTPGFLERIEKEAYKYCDQIFSEVEERLRKIKEEKERKRREYEEWRSKNLGNCYAERLDYSVGEMVEATIGKSISNVLKPGDKILVDVGLDAAIDPCFMTIMSENDTVHIDGYIPIADMRCRCRDFDTYALVELSLYMRGVLPLRRDEKVDLIDMNGTPVPIWPYGKFVVTRYKGNGVLEVISDDIQDYDYYLAVFTFSAHSTVASFSVDSVTGAAWYEAYEWTTRGTLYNLLTGEWQYAPGYDCCEQAPELIIPMLIRRGEEAKIRFSVIESEEREYEAVISTQSFLPVVRVRDITYEEERRENLGECADRLDYDVYNIRYANIGHGIQYLLKPGDKVAIKVNPSANPCLLQYDVLDTTLPVFGTKCECTQLRRRYMIFELPIRIRGRVSRWDVIIAEYRGDGVLEIIDGNDYDYYLTTFIYTPPDRRAIKFENVEVEGAVWYSAYFLRHFALLVRDGDSWEWMYRLAGCCNDEIPALIVPMLIRRGEKAVVKFTIDGRTYSAVVSDCCYSGPDAGTPPAG